MPREKFYEGLTLGEQVAKFIDFHADKRYRHISQYEAQLLDRVVVRLEQTLDVARREARREFEEVFERLSQLYETVVYDEPYAVSVTSFRARGDDAVQELTQMGLGRLADEPTPLQVQAAVAALFASSSNLRASFEHLLGDARRLESELDETSLAIVNRVLYQPTVVAENSWADVAGLLEHLGRANQKSAPVVLFGGTLLGTQNVVVALVAGASVIGLQMFQDVAEGMRPGLRRLGSRILRDPQEDEDPGE